MLTVFTEDLVKRPVIEIERMMSFVGLKVSAKSIEAILTADGYMKKLETVLDHIPSGEILRIIPENLIQAGIDSLTKELKATNGLSKWPCESFRKLGYIFFIYMYIHYIHIYILFLPSSFFAFLYFFVFIWHIPFSVIPEISIKTANESCQFVYVDDEMKPLPIHSKSLSANCSAPFVTCSVPYDQRGG